MLVRFVISNFLSFDQKTQFDMLPSAEAIDRMEHHLHDLGKTKILKSAAIYGANGAGKSNLIDACKTLQQWVRDGYIHTSINRQKFRLKEENKQQPISLLIEFFTAGKFLIYTLVVNDKTILEECLYESGFEDASTIIFEHRAPAEKLHLSTATDNLIIQNAHYWLTHHLIIMRPKDGILEFLKELCTNNDFFTFSNELLQTFNTGIDYLTLEKTEREQFLQKFDAESRHRYILTEPDRIFVTDQGRYYTTEENNQIMLNKITAFHHHHPFDLIEESLGTQRLLEFTRVFWTLLHKEVTILIDEIDHSIHPLMLTTIIKKISNTPIRGQLIYTTHESKLLDLTILRRDEIWFAQKAEETGATELYSLNEFILDTDTDIHKGYFSKRFGAIPITAFLELLSW